MFWTDGWGGRYTSQTELSYLEIIRNYGLIGATVIIVLFFSPFMSIVNNKKISTYYKYSFSIGYLAYLFIAGTNPLLNCATGYLTLALFAYMANHNVVLEVRNAYEHYN